MPIRYTNDPVLGWLVLIGDVVVHSCDTEEQCIEYINDWPKVW
ncbi:hypothetical protein [Effusibacillus consociatus]|uniref:Uncharacterized protein n=1 Tax=Effusibacillus consociatus TaxID=1117041 RepID=A0ABV9Q4H5_9BACL